MSLALSRYQHIRERQLYLFNILNNQTFTVFVTPKMLMSLDELRHRDSFANEGVLGDPYYYDEYQERTMTIPMIIDILPNLVSEKELGFREPNTNITMIYESIQEYLQNWAELVAKETSFKIPPMAELRNLELLAYTIFEAYRGIKETANTQHFYQKQTDEETVKKANLASLSMLLGMNILNHDRNGNVSWISHLDGMSGNKNYESLSDLGSHPLMTHKAATDSLASVTDSVHNLGEWTI